MNVAVVYMQVTQRVPVGGTTQGRNQHGGREVEAAEVTSGAGETTGERATWSGWGRSKQATGGEYGWGLEAMLCVFVKCTVTREGILALDRCVSSLT